MPKTCYVSLCLYGDTKYVDAFFKWYEQFIEVSSELEEYKFVVLLSMSSETLRVFPNIKQLNLMVCTFEENLINHHSFNMLARYQIEKFGIKFRPSDLVIFRDVDSTFTFRDIEALRMFDHSRKAFSIIHDHPAHNLPVLGGLFGANVGSFLDKFKTVDIELFKNKVRELKLVNYWGYDQHYLNYKLMNEKDIHSLSIFSPQNDESANFFKFSEFLGNKLLLGVDDYWLPNFRISLRHKIKVYLINLYYKMRCDD